jgi:hypothetical protein
MSPETLTGPQKAVAVSAFAALCGVILAIGLLLREHGPGNMGNGLLAGAGVALVGVAFAAWRLVARPDRTTSFERAWTQTGDERDDAVLTRSLAVLGVATMPLTGAAAIGVALGLDPAMVFALLLFAQIGLFGASFVIIQRRS